MIHIGFKKQWQKVKDNWFLIVLALVFFIVFSGGGVDFISDISPGSYSRGPSTSYGSAPLAVESSYASYPSPRGGDFAPEVAERKVTVSSSIDTEVGQGEFDAAASTLKSIIKSSDSILLNEDVDKYEIGDDSFYFAGRYTIKVDVTKYDSVIAKLKKIGEIDSFSENKLDVTGRITDLEEDIKSEQARLDRYQELYDEAIDIDDKIELTDLLFNQERRIGYMQDALENVGDRVDYATVNMRITEKTSDYSSIVFVAFSELIAIIVGSVSALLAFIFWIAPWAIAFFILRWVWKKTKKKR